MSRSVLFFFKAIVAIAGLLCLNSGSQAQTLVPLSGNNSVACGTNTTLYDHAGAATNYSNNANGYTVLDNSGTGVITLSGTYATESGYDYVRIYSGSGTGGTLLYTYSGTGSITTFSSSAGQVLTVQFTSDVSITLAGFAITVTYSGSCGSQTLVPLSGNNSVTCGTNTTLYDHAGAATNYSNNANGYTVLNNAGTGVITLSGTYSTESGYDYVRIYSGSGTGGTLLYTYSGTGSITTFSSSAGQTLTVQFTSDVSITQAGFALTVSYSGSCATCTAPTTQASNITAGSITANSASLSWTNGNGGGRVVYVNTTNTFTAPVNGSNPAANTVYASGQQCVFNGTTGPVTVTGLAASTTYWVRVYEFCTPDRNYQAATATNNPNSFTTAAGAPANDNCASAIAIASLPYTSAVISNAAATDDYSAASSCDGPYKNVWWTVTGICGTMTAITCTGGTDFDDEIAVYTGSCGSFTQVVCNDDNGAGCTSNYAGVSWTATAGTTYYITVGSYYSLGTTGNLQLNVTSTPATPSVAPTAITGTSTLCAGGSGTTLTATGGTLGTGASIQWFSGSCGGTSEGSGASISVNPSSTTTYYARYSGQCNTTTCAAVTVVVVPLPTLSCGTYGPACSDGADITLAATPAGGTWSGTGVTGTTFDPSAGTQTLTYNYTDPNYSVHSIAFSPRSTAGGGSLTLGDDQLSAAVPIGFSFNFFGNAYTDLYVSSNGFISFDAAAYNGCCGGEALPLASTTNNVIAAAWDDLYPPGGGGITYLSSGTAPNRTMVVDFNGLNYCCTSGTPMVTTQIVLYESSNAIEIHTTSINSIAPGTMGIENATGTVALVVPGRNSSGWSATNDAWRFVAPGCSNSCQTTITVNPAATANAGGPYTACGTSAVSISATASGAGSWSGGLGAFGNAGSASTTYTPDLSEVGGSVTLTWTTDDPDGAGPCTAVASNATVNVNTPATASAGGPYNTCGQTAASISATASGAGSWSGGLGTFGNPSSASTTYTPDASEVGTSVTLTWTTNDPDGAGPCTSVASNATLNVNICAWYSQSGGNVSDPIWSAFPVGTPGPATFTSATDMIVQTGNVVTNTSPTVAIDELTVDAGGTLVLDANSSLNTNGNVTVNGALSANDNSVLVMSSTAAQTASFASTTSFWDLSVDADVSCTVTGNVEVRGSLDLLDGNFDCTGNQVSLTSSATQTGRLGPVAPTASYTGNLKIERYRLAGPTNWLLMGSPIQSRTVANWQDDFITAGYPGSQFPAFDDPVGSGILWPSIRWYDEANTGTLMNDGLQGVSSAAQALSAGQGFAVWAGTSFMNTAAFTMDLGGSTPVIAQAPLTLPMSWTDTGTPAVDGWNLLSNPLPSPIAFDQIARGADIADFVTFYNPDNGNTAVWDISLNSGTNSATNTIQSMQGFFLKANGSAVATTVDESAKVNDNAGGMFGLTGEPAAHLRLRIGSGLNTFSDEAIMVFGEGQPGADAADAEKYVMAHNQAPQIATLTDGVQMAINAYGNADAGVSLPLAVNVGVTGEHTISAFEVGGLELSCLAIEDLETGALVSLLDGPGYTFTMDAAADPTVLRFILHINQGPDAAFTSDNSTVTVGQPVQFTAAQAASSYAWDFGDGSTSTEASPTHAWDAAGTYTVTLGVSDGLCSAQATTDITVELSTGAGHASAAEHRAWATPNGIAVTHAFTGTDPVLVELLDATGRQVLSRRMTSSRTVLPSNDLADGIWFVRLDNGTDRVTLRVPLAR